MRKQDFIRELTAALAPIDAQARAEILADIEEHFAEGAAHGQTEEEISVNLGQPGQIAEQVLEEYKAYKAQSDYGHTAGIDDIVSSAMETIDNLDIGGIVSSALKSAADASRAAGRAFEDAGSQRTGNGPRTVKWHSDTTDPNSPWQSVTVIDTDGATRVRGGYDIDIDKSFTGVTGIDMDLSMCDVNLVPSPHADNVRVTIQGRSRHNQFEVENKNGILYVRQKMPFFRFEIFGFNSTLNVTVYVPASFDGGIKVIANRGNTYAKGISGNLKLLTSAGNISIDGHSANKANLRSAAGSINITGCSIYDISAKSSAGNVTLENRETANLNLSSSAGNVNVVARKLGGETNLSASAGNVNLTAREVQGNITAKSSAGSVFIRLPQDVNCRIDVKKPSVGSLSNHLTGNPNSPYTLRVTTSVGSIALDPHAPLDPRQN